MKFEQLSLIKPILKAAKELNYQSPTPIQQQAVPPALAGRDVLGCAQTGTGKTAAFAMPILQILSKSNGSAGAKKPVIQALILTPTRELALQIQENICAYGKYTGLKSTVIFGGVSQKNQVEILQKGVDILVATPGRLIDLHNQHLIDLSNVTIFVLDEADRMLDMGFIHDVKRIIKKMPARKQTMFFSATMPKEVQALCDSLLSNPVKVAVTPVSSATHTVEQRLYFVEKSKKRGLLLALLQQEKVPQALVFTFTKHGADRVARFLQKQGIPSKAIHGDKGQTARQTALSDLKSGKIQVLVATDIAARGLDIAALPFVFNYDLPVPAETYVHRIGRTGRAGLSGVAVSFCDPAFEEERLSDIEKLLGNRIPLHETSKAY